MYVFSCYAKMQKLILAVYGLKYIEKRRQNGRERCTDEPSAWIRAQGRQ